MKKFLFIIPFVVLVSFVVFISCNDDAERVVERQKKEVYTSLNVNLDEFTTSFNENNSS